MIKLKQGLICGFAAAFLVSAADAHHSITPHYDSSTEVSATGVVTEFLFVNPHSFVYFDVEQPDGSFANWNCEMQAAVILRHSGWTEELLQPGTQITVTGPAARRDPFGCAAARIELADGTVMTRGGVIYAESGEQLTNSTGSSNEGFVPEDGATIFGSWRTTPHFRPDGDLVGDLISFPLDGERPTQEEIGTEENPLGIYSDYMTDQGREAAENYDLLYDDPALECSGASIMRAAVEPNGISEISQDGDTIYIKHQYMDVVRTIHMNLSEHPDNIEPSMVGHSIGRFENEELIIDTLGFEAGVLFPHPGILHSDQMRVVERIGLSDDGTQLIRSYEATDPLYFSKPIPGRIIWNRSDRALQSFDCVELSGENNIRPNQ